MPTDVLIPSLLISLLTLSCVLVLIAGFKRAIQQSGCWPNRALLASILLGLIIASWAALVSLLARDGFFSNFAALPPRLLFALVLPGIALGLIWNTRLLQAALEQTPIAWLIYLQSFRVAVELLLWSRYRAGLLPVQMTFAGRNFDILAGLTAPIIGLIWQRTRNRTVAIAWNVAGLTLLLNIVLVALMSMPTPLRLFKDGPPNVLLTEFPFIYLPAILVPLAYSAHFLSLRQLFRSRHSPMS